METDTGLIVRKNINEIYAIKLALLSEYERLRASDERISQLFSDINNYSFHRIEMQRRCYGVDASNSNLNEKEIDQRCWFYLIRIYQLQKYMLCTEHAKMCKQIEEFNFPPFNLENAEQWMDDLKSLVYVSVQKLIEDVFSRITEKTYYTGSGYSNRQEKKRNNNGIDAHFILTTYDWNAVCWYSGNPTITDDLEKACYIIDGKALPDQTIKEAMRKGKIVESENAYFRIRVCKNGNTHYWINDEIRQRLNFYGAKRGTVGESIRIKIFEKE